MRKHLKPFLIVLLTTYILIFAFVLPQGIQSRETDTRIVKPTRRRHFICPRLRRTLRRQRRLPADRDLASPCDNLENMAYTLLNLSSENSSSTLRDFSNLLSKEITQNFSLEILTQAVLKGLLEQGPITSFSLTSFVVQNGNWAETKIQLTTSSNRTQTFKIILHLEDEQWKIFGTEKIEDFIANEVIIKRKGESRSQRIKLKQDESVAAAIDRLQKDPDLKFVEPNYMAFAQMVPNDPYYNPYQWNFPQIGAESAWNTSSGKEIIVAVVDTGVAYETARVGRRRYYQAPDLAQTSFVPGFDFVENDSHPNDNHGHGTHVAGTLASSTNNHYGVAGLAFDAKIMPIKVLDRRGSGSYFDIAQGIYYATDHGAQVINLSLGGSFDSQTLREAVQYAYNKGVVVIAAAGNDGEVGSSAILYPAAYDDFVLAVGAVRYDQQKTWYSNGGPSLDLVAPGGDLEVDQNNDGYADGILQQTIPGYRDEDKFAFYFFQGTSMAAPHVSAASAMLLAKGASNPDEIKTLLQNTTTDLGPNGRDDKYGYGLININEALQKIGGGLGTSPTPTLTPTPTLSPLEEPTPTPLPTFTPTPTQAPTNIPLEINAATTDRRGNPQTNFSPRDRVYIQGRVTTNSQAVKDVLVNIQVEDSLKQGVENLSENTNSRGEFDASFRLSRTAPSGEYKVKIGAQKEGFKLSETSLVFTVL